MDASTTKIKRRESKRMQWTKDSMDAALQAVKDGQTVTAAAKQHGVPKSTLYDRVTGRVTHGRKPGPNPYLTKAEETELSKFLIVTNKAGYGKTRAEVKSIAERTLKFKETEEDAKILKGDRVTDGWFNRFMERNDKLSLRKGDATANVQMDCLNTEAIKSYFDLLKSVLENHNLMKSPGQIYNVDETGMPLNHRTPKVVTQKGQKKVRVRTTGDKSQITIVGCVSASGQVIPPYVIFDTATLNLAWTEGEVPGTQYGLSKKGWIDTKLFYHWLTHFLLYAVPARPLLLLLDGHSSHFQPEVLKEAKKRDVIVFCLPPHTTHASQPLDAAVFGPLKQHWTNVCHKYMQKNPGKGITKYQFSGLLKEAWMETIRPSNICAGFKKCGIFPFDPKAIECTTSAPKMATTPTTSELNDGKNF